MKYLDNLAKSSFEKGAWHILLNTPPDVFAFILLAFYFWLWHPHHPECRDLSPLCVPGKIKN